MRHQFTRRNKYGTSLKERRTRNGITFDSLKEADRYDELRLMMRGDEDGMVLFFLRQVPIHLPGNTRYVLDFLIFWRDGTVTFEDVKGMETDTFKLKKRMVEDLYPFEITVRK